MVSAKLIVLLPTIFAVGVLSTPAGVPNRTLSEPQCRFVAFSLSGCNGGNGDIFKVPTKKSESICVRLKNKNNDGYRHSFALEDGCPPVHVSRYSERYCEGRLVSSSTLQAGCYETGGGVAAVRLYYAAI